MSGPRCISLPNIPYPDFAFDLKLVTPSIGIALNLALCCKLPPLSHQIPPIQLPFRLSFLELGVIRQYIDQANAWINALPLSCPLE